VTPRADRHTEHGPDTAATKDLVRTIRQHNDAVTGLTAINIDISAELGDALLPYLTVVGLALVLLMLVFRSLLVPVKAAAGFLPSMAGHLRRGRGGLPMGLLGGVIGLEQTGPIISLLPIFLVGIVFGLAMDYPVFLVTRMREDYVHVPTPVRP